MLLFDDIYWELEKRREVYYVIALRFVHLQKKGGKEVGKRRLRRRLSTVGGWRTLSLGVGFGTRVGGLVWDSE